MSVLKDDKCWEFPSGLAVKDLAVVTAVARVQSLALELSIQKKKKKKKKVCAMKTRKESCGLGV